MRTRWIVSVVALVFLAGPALGGDVETGNGGGGPADASPSVPKEPSDVGVGGALVDVCKFTNTFGGSATADNLDYHGCIARHLRQQGVTVTYNPSGLNGMPMLTVLENGVEPTSMCYKEADPDIRQTGLRFNSGPSGIGKIRLLIGNPTGYSTNPPILVSSIVGVKVNGSSWYTYTIQPGNSAEYVNQQLASLLEDAYAAPVQEGGEGGQAGLLLLDNVWELGLKSTDAGLITTEIAIEPDQGPSGAGPEDANTLCQ